MARYVFTWELGQGLGHLVRYLPLVRSLLGRGDEVWFLVKNASQAAKVFAGLPVHIEQIEPGRTPAARQLRVLNSYPQILHNFGFHSAAELGKQVAGWTARLSELRPDVLIIDHSPTVLAANRISKIPSIASGTGFTIPPATMPMRALRYWELPHGAQLQRSERQVLDVTNSVLQRFNAPPIEALSELICCDAMWLLSFSELDHYGSRDSAQYYGNFPVRGHGQAPIWKDHDGPKVFAYLSGTNVPDEFAAALRELNVNLCLFAPNLAQGEERHFVGSRTFRSVLPLDLELAAAQCDVAITNGGLNTVSAFFLAGTPQLVFADNLERYMVGRRLEFASVGLLSPVASDRTVAAKLRAVLFDRSISRAARRCADKYRGENSATQLEKMLADIARLTASSR